MISALEVVTSEISGFETPIGEGEMAEWQFSRIRDAMRRSVSNSAACAGRFAGVDISSITSYEALESVPFTYPEEITKRPLDFVCVPGRDISRVTSLNTSGSTGAPKRIFFTEKDLARTARLFEIGMAPIIGPRGRRCVVMMSDTTPGSMGSLLKEGVERSGVPASVYGFIYDADDAARYLRDGDVLVGVPAQILHLCRKYPKLRPESILLTADYVPAPLPDAIRELWGCRVYTHFGMTETCFGCAVQCSETSAQHIRHDSLLIEIIDPKSGKALPPGKEGEIAVTVFANEAMPLFRYRTGDISSLETGKCECGSVLPRLGRVRGRLKNIYSTECGSFSIEAIDDVLYKNRSLWRYSAVLSEEEKSRVLYVKAAGDDSLNAEDILKRLSDILPRGIKASVEVSSDKEGKDEVRKRHMTLRRGTGD